MQLHFNSSSYMPRKIKNALKSDCNDNYFVVVQNTTVANNNVSHGIYFKPQGINVNDINFIKYYYITAYNDNK